MESQQHGSVSRRTVFGLVVAILAIDVVANSIVPQAARVPAKLAILLLLLVWARRGPGLSWGEMGLGRAQVGAGLRLGGLVALIIAAGIGVLVAVPATRSFFETKSIAVDSAWQHVLMPIVIIPIGTVLFEEVIFRGVLLGTLLRTTKVARRAAVLVSAGVFGLWHVPPLVLGGGGTTAGAVVGTVFFTSAVGVFFAALRLRSGSVLAPILVHTAANSGAYLAALAVS